MYTPSYKRVGDNGYVGVIKENKETVLVGTVVKKSITDALRHAEAYIHEYYMHQIKDRMQKYRGCFVVFSVMTIMLFVKLVTAPKLTSVAVLLPMLLCAGLFFVSIYCGIVWLFASFEYKEIIESFDPVPPNFFSKGKSS